MEQGNLRRINPDRGATTLLTDSAPGGMYTGAIHWDQRRTLTVAERKRIQGVPDSYVLHGTVQQVRSPTKKETTAHRLDDGERVASLLMTP